ncbi:MAG: phosphoglucosamine mutase [Candidatus Micrarchaeota archaeon]|nr:phosphoglucosamine mutase [Candidatus Micrarchaeota archaeon]
MGLFGTSGIRGKFGEFVTPELALKVGKAIVERQGEKVFVGRDTRLSGPVIEAALVAGVVSAGGEAVRLGVAPTPTVALAGRDSKAVMITASHNPPDYNGMKIFGKGGEVQREFERRVEFKVEKGIGAARWDELGSESFDDGAVRRHMDAALAHADVGLIRKKAPKVLIDCGNGAGCSITPYVLREAGCRVVGVNADKSGIFARGLEPNAENLSETCRLVKACGADIGIAHDGDADRAVAIDENGEMVGLDAQLALMCGYLLGKGGKGTGKGKDVASTVEASLAVRESVEKAGGRLHITRVGSLDVANAIREKGCFFGGEPCGEYIFPEEVMVPDGVLCALKLVEMTCALGKLSALRKKVKIYPMRRSKYECRDKEKAMRAIREKMKAFEGRMHTIDGIRVDFENGWVMVRPSGTEPAIRITCEHRNAKGLEKVFKQAEGIVKSSL